MPPEGKGRKACWLYQRHEEGGAPAGRGGIWAGFKLAVVLARDCPYDGDAPSMYGYDGLRWGWRCGIVGIIGGEGDVAFTVGAGALKQADATPMEKFEVKLMVHRDNPLSRKAAADIRDLGRYPLYIESSQFNIHHDILGRCEAAGVTPHIAFETSGFSLCQKMVAQNKGISVIVDFISDDMQNSNLVLLPFADGPYYWETYMLTRRGEAPNPDVLLFRDFVLAWMRAIKRGEIQR